MTTTRRVGWTPLQIAWADHAAAESAHHDAELGVEDAQMALEDAQRRHSEGELSAFGLRLAQEAYVAATDRVDATEQELRDAERALWAVTRLTRTQVAALVSDLTGRGTSPDTWSGYVTRRQAPECDSRDDTGHPWWFELTIREWVAARPGRGARTDLTR